EGATNQLTMRFVNTGRAGAVFLVYAAHSLDAPHTYTVEAGKRLQDALPLNADGTYDFTVYGPNGFLRRFAGKPVARSWWNGSDIARPEVLEGYDVVNGNLQLRLENVGSARCQFTIVNAYDVNNVIRH